MILKLDINLRAKWTLNVSLVVRLRMSRSLFQFLNLEMPIEYLLPGNLSGLIKIINVDKRNIFFDRANGMVFQSQNDFVGK